MQAQTPLPHRLSQSLSTLHWVEQHPGGTLFEPSWLEARAESVAHSSLGWKSAGEIARVSAWEAGCEVVVRAVTPPAAISAAMASSTNIPRFPVIRVPPLESVRLIIRAM